uniref:Uncharacterized protein n=1 Tax=Terrapene triunguis TaxID=2587831 RepID=A0A674J3Z5_9SAUR
MVTRGSRDGLCQVQPSGHCQCFLGAVVEPRLPGSPHAAEPRTCRAGRWGLTGCFPSVSGACSARVPGEPAGGQAGQAERGELDVPPQNRGLLHPLDQPAHVPAAWRRLLDRQHQVPA